MPSRSRSPFSGHSAGSCIKEAKSALKALAHRTGADIGNLLDKVDEDNVEAFLANVARGRCGEVQCGVSGRRGQADQKRVGFLQTGVSKRRGKLGVALSPFTLMTPKSMMRFATSDGTPSGKALAQRPLELVWQAAKVKHCEQQSGIASKAYFERRARIYNEGLVKRSYIQKQDIAGTLVNWRDSSLIEWVPSRKFYCVAYAMAAKNTAAYSFLEAAHRAGWNLLLGGPDGFPLSGSASATSPSSSEMASAYTSEERPFGHERVLVAMLLGESPWESQPTVWP